MKDVETSAPQTVAQSTDGRPAPAWHPGSNGDGTGVGPGNLEHLTEVRRQETLLKTGALQDAIFNSANFSSIATDAKGVIQIFNVGAERMPNQTGLDFLRIVKGDSTLRAIPFVFLMSSVWGESERSAAVSMGVTRFILRPIEPKALLAEIADCLRARL